MVDSLKEVAEQADEAIISMVRDYAQNVDVIFGEDGLLTAKTEGKTIIVMSTLDPETMNKLGKKVEEESNYKLISAAVSGGASGAEPGSSQVAKLVNNLILGININAVAEGLKLARYYQLPEEEVINLLKVSTGDSWVARNWSDVSQWTAETALSVLLKDLIASYNQGIKHNIPMPFNALSSTQLFDSMGKEKPKE